MTETTLRTLMRESAETIPTSAPPLVGIARQARRRRAGIAGLAAAAVLAVTGTAAALPSLDLGSASPAPAGPVDDGSGRGGPSPDMASDDVPLAYLPNHGQPARGAGRFEDEVRGELRLVEERCLVVGDDGVRLVWPVDYIGMTHGDGSLSLLDETGEPVAEVGDVLRLQGSWQGPADWGAGEPCLPDRMVFMVQAVPEVVR
jgi:hypothetical protein